MSFRSLIRSDPTQALASWGNQSIPMCQWRGVACGLSGRRTGRVVALDLTKLNLVGTISPLLGNLTYLRRLHLHKNRLHGEIPSELGHLRDLRHLNRSYNSIQGPIPATLSTCRGMENIWLYSNKWKHPFIHWKPRESEISNPRRKQLYRRNSIRHRQTGQSHCSRTRF